MAISSIHIQPGKTHFLYHNDRTHHTQNSIFNDEENEYLNDAEKAYQILHNEIQKRSEEYKKRTGQKVQKKMITHLSAIVNLNHEHTLNDLKELADYLEKEFDTRVVQIAIHRDEGHIDENGNKIKNYHAHLEFLGLDSMGNSVRRKLTKSALSNLQTKTAEILGMQRGKNYAKEKAKRPRRLDTYEYKEAKKKEENAKKEMKAKIKDVNEQNKKLREELKKRGAKREDYAKLEALIKELKEEARNKNLTIDEMQYQLNSLYEDLYNNEKSKEIEIEEYKKENLEKQLEVNKLKNEVEILKDEVCKRDEIIKEVVEENGKMKAFLQSVGGLYEKFKSWLNDSKNDNLIDNDSEKERILQRIAEEIKKDDGYDMCVEILDAINEHNITNNELFENGIKREQMQMIEIFAKNREKKENRLNMQNSNSLKM